MSEKVKNMFSAIAGKYDLMNSVLSMNIHHHWRHRTVALAGLPDKSQVLDCACGTGDLAIEFKKHLKDRAEVTAIDFSAAMLEIARRKAREKHFEIDFQEADVLHLPFDNNQFDCTTIAFGIRNVDSTIDCLREMARVTRKGGLIIVLEFGQPLGLFAYLYKIYSKMIIPFVGKLISGSNDAYTYLPETAAKYPCREEFIEIMRSAGCLENCTFLPLTFGITYIYVGIKKQLQITNY